jgi:PTH2 family peptidyl-tRNA hydrolase
MKQVIVIRRDLNMRRGKEIAQGAHASMAFLVNAANDLSEFDDVRCLVPDDVYRWFDNGHKKVTLHVRTEQDILLLHAKARELGLRSHYIVDEGWTEFNMQPTITCLAIGPNESSLIDTITGNLPLY